MNKYHLNWKSKVKIFDDRRNIVIPGDKPQTIDFCVSQFIEIANSSIKDHDYFAVALSGGSTPKAIFEILSSDENKSKIDWTKVLLFWSDERSVSPDSPESNYHMAMQAGFSKLNLKKDNIFRMKAEEDIENHAKVYQRLIETKIPSKTFDAVLLGMGDDGHTASLFPETHGLKDQKHLVIANYVPSKNTWRMTLTYECINAAKNILIYVIGADKSLMVKKVLAGPFNPFHLPIQKIGTQSRRALWILDNDAASQIKDI